MSRLAALVVSILATHFNHQRTRRISQRTHLHYITFTRQPPPGIVHRAPRCLHQSCRGTHTGSCIAERVHKVRPRKAAAYSAFVQSELRKLALPATFSLCHAPRVQLTGIAVAQCEVMTSKKLPLRLDFVNADPHVRIRRSTNRGRKKKPACCLLLFACDSFHDGCAALGRFRP